jgi:hypothetical protein
MSNDWPTTGTGGATLQPSREQLMSQLTAAQAEVKALKRALELVRERLAVCPWPESAWPMTEAEYIKAVPDPHQRTAISGAVMRWGWELAQTTVNEAIAEAEEAERDGE